LISHHCVIQIYSLREEAWHVKRKSE
jgi:hypothetical protein